MADDKQEPDDEFERFENLTRRLLTVRKEDLDKQRREKDALPETLGKTANLD